MMTANVNTYSYLDFIRGIDFNSSKPVKGESY